MATQDSGVEESCIEAQLRRGEHFANLGSPEAINFWRGQSKASAHSCTNPVPMVWG